MSFAVDLRALCSSSACLLLRVPSNFITLSSPCTRHVSANTSLLPHLLLQPSWLLYMIMSLAHKPVESEREIRERRRRKGEEMAAGTAEEPILSRVDRLDTMLRQLEEMRGVNSRSPKSSCASTPTSGTLTSDDLSPKSLEKHCRPINNVIMETEIKGSLVERLDLMEDRLLKVCLKMEVELEAEKKREEEREKNEKRREKKSKKGLKDLVSVCVKGRDKS